MNTRFLGALAFAAALALPTVACAQQGPAQPNNGAPAAAGHHRGGPAAALEGLNLTPDQRDQIKAAIRADRAAAKSSDGQQPDPATRKANREKMIGDIEQVLTPDQRTQFETNLRAMRHGGGQPPAGAPNQN
jgi:Spy/CpxP family protein refolding chaperone